MEIPGSVSLYCPLVDAKGTAAKLIAINPEGFYHLEVSVKGGKHTMFVPIGQAAVLFSEPEPFVEDDGGFEVER